MKKKIYTIFVFVISLLTLLTGSLKLFLFVVLPDFLYQGGGEEQDYASAILISMFLSLTFSLLLTYLFNRKSKKLFLLFYIIAFIILFIIDLYILRNR